MSKLVASPMRSDEILFWVQDALARRKASGQFRLRRILDPAGVARIVDQNGRKLVNFASNDYLGLSQNQHLLSIAAATRSVGAGAAPLISGYTSVHASAEQALAKWKGTDRAVLLPSGYQANHAAVQAVAGAAAGKKLRFLIDKLSHASLIDAVRGTGEPMRVWPHNGLEKLERLLADAPADELQVVVTESIFSMDGDRADLAGLAELKTKYPFVLILDEAHASGVYGEGGAGLAAEMGLSGLADLTVITLSKAFGSAGGVICCSAAWADAVVNFGRAYLFSTSVPPSVAAVAEAAIGVMRDEPWRRERVRALALRVRTELAAAGLEVPAGDSPIIPIVLGDEGLTMETAERLYGEGMLVGAVRPPTVAPRTSRLRITLTCEHSDDQIGTLLGALCRLGGE